MGELLTEPHDGHGAGDTCPACPHQPAVPDPTVEALSEVVLRGLRDGWRDDYSAQSVARSVAAEVTAFLAARAAAPDALRVRVEALIEHCRGNYADDAGGGEPLRNYVLIEELRALLDDGAQ